MDLFRIIGEFFGTYIMVTLGLGTYVALTTLTKKNIGRTVISVYWGMSFFLAAMVGSFFFKTSNYNPVFSIYQFVLDDINGVTMLGEIGAQCLGALAAAFSVSFAYEHIFNTENLPLELGLFATVPANKQRTIFNIFIEALGVVILAVNAIFQGYAHLSFFPSTVITSIVLGLAVFVCEPHTGAALNPARDFMPRLFYHFRYSSAEEGTAQWDYAWVPILGEVLGITAILLISYFIL